MRTPYYRIPALARLNDGSLLAAADQRLETESDWGGLIELALRIKEKQITTTNFTYSCLEETKEPGVFALLYEERKEVNGEEKEHLKYVEFDFDWLMK